MKVTGGCHCGHITYEAEVDSATIRVCHCTDCQKLTGTAFRVNISAQPETFKLKSGMLKNYVRTAESGNKCAHAFCPECGTPIYVIPSEPSPSGYRLALGAIDQRAQFASGEEVGSPMTVMDVRQSSRPMCAHWLLRLEDRWHPVCRAPR